MDKDDLRKELAKQQKVIDKEFKKNGLTDEVLDKQIELNKIRHKHDISDESQAVYKDYVQ